MESKHKLSTHLDLPRQAGACGLSEIRAAQGRAESVELRCIENVEKFEPQLESCALLISREWNPNKIFEERNVPVVDSRTKNDVASRIAKLTGRHRGKAEVLNHSATVPIPVPTLGFPTSSG